MASVKVGDTAGAKPKEEVVNHFADYDMWRAKHPTPEEKMRLTVEKRQRTRELNRARALANPEEAEALKTKKTKGQPRRRGAGLDKETRAYYRRALNFTCVREEDLEAEEEQESKDPSPQPSIEGSSSCQEDMARVRGGRVTRGRGRGGRAAVAGAENAGVSTRGRGTPAGRGRGRGCVSAGRGRGGLLRKANKVPGRRANSFNKAIVSEAVKGGWSSFLGFLSPSDLQVEQATSAPKKSKPIFVGYEGYDEEQELQKYWHPDPPVQEVSYEL